MKRYFINSIVISVLLVLFYLTVSMMDFGFTLHEHFLTLIIFFFIQSIPIAWLLKQGEKDPSSFVMYALASIGLRMISGLFFLLAFFFLKVSDITSFAVQFSAVYLIYLVFELTVVLANLRRN